MSESNLPPEQWRPLFDKAGIEFGYRPLAARAGLTHTRVHRLIRGGGTTPEAIKQVADALGVAPSKVRALRDEPADVEPFTLPDDAGRLTHDERNVVRAVVRALLDARDRHATDSPTAGSPPAEESGTPGAEDERQKIALRGGSRVTISSVEEALRESVKEGAETWLQADDGTMYSFEVKPFREADGGDALIEANQPSGVDTPAVDNSEDWRADEAARRAARGMREAPKQDRKVE